MMTSMQGWRYLTGCFAMFAIAMIFGIAAACSSATGGGGSAPASTTITSSGGSSVAANSAQTLTVYRDDRGSVATLAAPVGAVWAVLPHVYAELEVPVATMQSRERLIGNPEHEVRRSLAGQPLSRYLRCGTGPFGTPLADSYNVILGLHTAAQPIDEGGTRLVTTFEARAVNRTVSGTAVQCTSTGKLEERLAEMVRNHIAG